VQDHVSALFFGFVKRVGGLFSASIDDLFFRAQTVELVLLTLDRDLLFLQGSFLLNLVSLLFFNDPGVNFSLLLKLLSNRNLLFNLALDFLLEHEVH